jgi:hypothetical protein
MRHSNARPQAEVFADTADILPLKGRSTTLERRSGPTAIRTKRLNINLPLAVFNELAELARDSNRSITEVVRISLGLLAAAFDAEGQGHKLAIVQSDGRPIKEIVLPK